MTVILRAFLVVGVLTYFASQKREEGLPAVARDAQQPRAEITALTAAWTSLSDDAREKLAREGAAEIVRRFSAAKPSQDTLASGDRRPAWRGAVE